MSRGRVFSPFQARSRTSQCRTLTSAPAWGWRRLHSAGQPASEPEWGLRATPPVPVPTEHYTQPIGPGLRGGRGTVPVGAGRSSLSWTGIPLRGWRPMVVHQRRLGQRGVSGRHEIIPSSSSLFQRGRSGNISPTLGALGGGVFLTPRWWTACAWRKGTVACQSAFVWLVWSACLRGSCRGLDE